MSKFVEEYNYLRSQIDYFRSQIEKSIRLNLELLENKTAVFEGEFYDNLGVKLYVVDSHLGMDNVVTKVSLSDVGIGLIRVDLSNGSSVNSEFISTFDLAYIADFIETYTKEKLGNA